MVSIILKNTKTTVNDYDLILTGDLGKVGTEIFKEILKKAYAKDIVAINNIT